ncbi:MAG TPA: 30S ribosomal protein S13, partial [Pantoea ananatis]|nr:30S ribosomal protein S13 [Pantoea ananatis]
EIPLRTKRLMDHGWYVVLSHRRGLPVRG